MRFARAVSKLRSFARGSPNIPIPKRPIGKCPIRKRSDEWGNRKRSPRPCYTSQATRRHSSPALLSKLTAAGRPENDPTRIIAVKIAEVPNFTGAGDRTRTYDLMITNQLLYQLSYTGMFP